MFLDAECPYDVCCGTMTQALSFQITDDGKTDGMYSTYASVNKS